MGKLIAVEGCSLELSSGEALVKTITTSASTVSKCEGLGIYRGTITISISGYTGGSIVASSGSGVGTLTGTAEYVTVENFPVVLEDDESEDILIIGVDQDGDPAKETITVTVSSAGQSSVKGE